MSSVSRKKNIAQAGGSSVGINAATQTALDGKLAIASNLSDLNNAITARNNLGTRDLFVTTGDQTTTVATSTDITGLGFTPIVSKRYKVDGVIRLGCNNTGGVKIQVTLPTGSTVSVEVMGRTNSGTAFLSSVIGASATLTAAFCTVNSFVSVILNGEISVGATPGNVQFGFASTTGTQTSTIYQLGTCVTFTQLN